jgi:hypothetical protein
MAKRPARGNSTLPKGQVHPYVRWEGTPLWKAIQKGVADLVENQDLVENEHREYIVGYICKIVERRKSAIATQLSVVEE